MTSPKPAVGDRQRVQVLSVTDGDTIRVRIDGRSTPVRYIGIDTPETVDPRKDVQCFGKEASDANRRLVEEPAELAALRRAIPTVQSSCLATSLHDAPIARSGQ